MLDGKNLQFANQPDGRKKAIVDVVVTAVDPDNNLVSTSQKRHTVEAAAPPSSLVFHVDLDLKRPGPYDVRTAVRDADDGKTGSASTFVDIPDFDKPQLALSSLVLDGDATGQVQYRCDIFGARMQAGKPHVEFEIRIYRGSELIFTSKSLPAEFSRASKRMLASGSIRLPAGLTGDYSVELVAHDRLVDAKAPAAVAWSGLPPIAR